MSLRFGYRLWRALSRGARACLVVSAFAWFWSGALVLAWLILPLVAVCTRRPGAIDNGPFAGAAVNGAAVDSAALAASAFDIARTRNCQRAVGAAFRLFHWYMRVLGLLDARHLPSEVPPSAEAEPGRASAGVRGPVVMVANHPTLVDVTAILCAYPHACCMAGAKYATNPLFGRVLRLCGFINAGRDLTEISAGFNEAARRLNQGFDILVFPEGTRSPPHGLGLFQRGAFEIACRANVPIQPMLLRCEPSALTKDRPFWQQPDTTAILTIEPLPLVPMSHLWQNSRQLRQFIETRYRDQLSLDPPR